MEIAPGGKAVKALGDEMKQDVNTADAVTSVTGAGYSSSSQDAPLIKYKYREAHPCPDGVQPDYWNKLYTAADSRIYNRQGKSSTKSAAARASGETRKLTLEMLAEKRAKSIDLPSTPQSPLLSDPLSKLTTNFVNTNSGGQPSSAITPITPLVTSNIKMEQSSSRDATPASFSELTPSIADKVKGKSRGKGKKIDNTNSSNQGSPIPSSAPAGLNAFSITDKLKVDASVQKVSPAASHQGSPPPLVSEQLSKTVFDSQQGTKVELDWGNRSGSIVQSEKAVSTPPAEAQTQPASKPRKKQPKKKKGKSGSPAPTAAKENKSKGKSTSPDADEGSEDSESNDGGEYCICRGPDDHRKMIACDACDEWYHCSCVDVNEDHIELIDKYICEKCKIPDKRFTTWKPTCRLRGCNKPARADTNPPSKYCSDAHKKKWAQELVRSMPQGPGPSRGGALTRPELRAVLDQTAGDVKAFHALGAKPELPASRPINWNEVLTNEEKGRTCEIKIQRIELDLRSQGFNDRAQFLKIAMERTRRIMDENPELSGICGYDSRLSFNEVEFTAWRESTVGKKAFETGKLEDGSYCDKKKCDKHKYWLKVGMQDAKYEVAEIQKAINKLRNEERAIQQRANTREASKM